MPGERRPGMDHSHYAYSALPAREPLRWPEGSPLALWVILYLEDWELQPPADSYRPPGIHGVRESHFPDYRTFSHREYGNRVGVFRVLELLDELGLRPTVAVNSSVCERLPRVLRECLDRGWEIAAHGTHATRMITSRMSEEQEREHIGGAIQAIASATGRRPQGWIGQEFGESTRTPELVAQAGMAYIADWPNDDQPYPTRHGDLVSLPQQPNWDDVQLLWLRQLPSTRYPALLAEACDVMLEEGATQARMLTVGIHPWLSGQSHRIRYLRSGLTDIARRAGVWNADGATIASHYAAWQRQTRQGVNP